MVAGKTVVIKYGGAAMTDPALKVLCARSLVVLRVTYCPAGRSDP